MARKRISPKLKFEAALINLKGEKTPGQISRLYRVHPNSVALWTKTLVERGPEIFAQDTTVAEYERRIAELEQLLGKKEVEIALLKLLGPDQMTTAAKVARVAAVQADFGLASALAALALPRATWYYHQRHVRPYAERYAALRGPLEEIARQHPGYGYRRMTVELQQAYDLPVNHKVVQRLLQAWDLPVIRGIRRPRPSGVRQALQAAGARANLVAGQTIRWPGQVLYTDFTELVYANGQHKARLMPLLDHVSKVVWGWALGPHAVTALALQAWRAAWARLRRWGLARPGLIVHHDQDPVYTGYGWTGRLLLREGGRVSYALHGARDNPEMESFFSRFKEENQSLFLEAQTVPELAQVVAARLRYYNARRRHSTIGYVAPRTYLQHLLSTSSPQFLRRKLPNFWGASPYQAIGGVDAEKCFTKPSKEPRRKKQMLYAPRELNKAFKREFIEIVKGWKSVRVASNYATEHYEPGFQSVTTTRGSYREIDFVKNRIGVEIQFGKYSFMVYNVAAKMTIFHNLDFIDVGVEVVPVKDMVVKMSSGVSYFEQFVWDLSKRGVSNIDIPVLILGITSDLLPTKIEPDVKNLL